MKRCLLKAKYTSGFWNQSIVLILHVDKLRCTNKKKYLNISFSKGGCTFEISPKIRSEHVHAGE